MKKLFSVLAAISVAMVLIAGSGAYLISKTLIAQSKVDAVSSAAKGMATTLSLQISLFERLLEKMAQDPDVVNTVIQNNPALIAVAEKKLADRFPDIIHIKIITADQIKSGLNTNPDLSFADQQMVKQTFAKEQLSAIQGEGNDRHLSITRRIIQNNTAIAVILAGIRYDFINTSVANVSLEKGYLELRQDKLVLATAGEKKEEISSDNPSISVGNTDWKIYLGNNGMPNFLEFSLIFSMTLIPALVVALGFVTGYRKFTDTLRAELSWVIKAVKDILIDKPLGNYPIKLQEVNMVITTLAQFKRVVTEKKFDF